MHMSVFSPATLRHYDTTPYYIGLMVSLFFSSGTTTVRLHPLLVSLFFSSDTTTVQHHPLLYIVNLCFSSNTVTVRRYPLLYIVNLFFLQRQYDSTTPHLNIYCKSIFSPATLRQYDTTPYYMVSLYFLQRHCDTTIVRQHPLNGKSIFLKRHCDTTTVRHHPLLYLVNLCFL